MILISTRLILLAENLNFQYLKLEVVTKKQLLISSCHILISFYQTKCMQPLQKRDKNKTFINFFHYVFDFKQTGKRRSVSNYAVCLLMKKEKLYRKSFYFSNHCSAVVSKLYKSAIEL